MPSNHDNTERGYSLGPRPIARGTGLLVLGGGILLASGCGSDTQWVDQNLDRVLLESSRDMGTEAPVPSDEGWMSGAGTAFPGRGPVHLQCAPGARYWGIHPQHFQ